MKNYIYQDYQPLIKIFPISFGDSSIDINLLHLRIYGDNSNNHSGRDIYGIMQHIEHIQLKRRDNLKDKKIREYSDNKEFYLQILANANNLPKDNIIIFSPPSRFNIDISEYREAIKNRFEINSVKDITDRFKKRNPNILCGEGVNANEEITKNLEYHCQNDEHEFRNIVIVDDIYSTGRTVEACLNHLKISCMHRLETITVVCPLWIKNKTS